MLEITEFDKSRESDVKDLLVELQQHLAELDSRGVIVLKDNFRDGYYNYVLHEVERHDGKIFVAVKNGAAVGAVICKIFCGGDEEQFTTSCPKTGFISDLVVTKSERNRGIGRALLRRAEQYFAEKGCDYSQLEVFAPNARAAALYKNLGYETLCTYLSKNINRS